MSDKGNATLVDKPIDSLFPALRDLAAVTIEDWFNEAFLLEPTFTKQYPLVENLNHIARQQPTQQWATKLRDVSITFLNGPPMPPVAVTPYVVSLFRRLIYLYPNHIFIQFALSKYYLLNNSLWDGVRALKMIARNKVIRSWRAVPTTSVHNFWEMGNYRIGFG